ncbi:sodium:solute symporter family transporter [Flammeovirga agarivorans]|uniref:Sodium/solute symporter n=1 Tax=Flammeovirga agarivorans TaxID=2726742 RepID=A0A7X8SPE4_9BACT|nr:sodium/solute symporter [Flammeovirga agarivorans]NLR93960.1 sodium/solute symporter [Flammeovirga agarivorans]
MGLLDFDIDHLVILLYLVSIFLLGAYFSKKSKRDAKEDFLTGKRELGWFSTALVILSMSIDTGIMGVAGVGYVWGFAIQPNAANMWFVAPLVVLVFIPIYWKSGIKTTPEYLEKRFDTRTSTLFSLMMAIYNVVILGTSIYLGGLILNEFIGISTEFGALLLLLIVGGYVIFGGMNTVLKVNIFQSIFILITLFVIGVVTFISFGGWETFINIQGQTKAETSLLSTLGKYDLDIFTESWYPLPFGILWACIAGMSWIACNYGMVQRLLTAKSEVHAQKGILMMGVLHVITFSIAYIIGIISSQKFPDVLPDKSYLLSIQAVIPKGGRGLIISGLIASLISTVDGLLTATGTSISLDIYKQLFKPKASSNELKKVARIVQVSTMIIALFLVMPMAMKSPIITDFIQGVVADIFSVISALFCLGIFTRRINGKSAFYAMLIGIIISVSIHFLTNINFVYRGIFSFFITIIVAFALSINSKRKNFENLTIYDCLEENGQKSIIFHFHKMKLPIFFVIIMWLLFTIVWEGFIVH